MPTGQQNPTTFADQSSWQSIRRSHTCAHTHTTHASRTHQAHITYVCARTVLKNSIPQLLAYVRMYTVPLHPQAIWQILLSAPPPTHAKSLGQREDLACQTGSHCMTHYYASHKKQLNRLAVPGTLRHTHQRKGVRLCDSAVKNKHFTRQRLATISFGYKQNVL